MVWTVVPNTGHDALYHIIFQAGMRHSFLSKREDFLCCDAGCDAGFGDVGSARFTVANRVLEVGMSAVNPYIARSRPCACIRVLKITRSGYEQQRIRKDSGYCCQYEALADARRNRSLKSRVHTVKQ